MAFAVLQAGEWSLSLSPCDLTAFALFAGQCALSLLDADDGVGRTDECVDDGCERGADERRDDEQPELLEGPSSDEDCRSDAAGRVHGGVGDGNADQVNEDKHQADGDSGKSDRGFNVGRSEDSQNQNAGQDDLGDEACSGRILAGGMGCVSVCAQAGDGCDVAIRGSLGDEKDDGRGDDGSDDLRDDIANGILRADLFRQEYAEGNGGVDVTAGDW